MNDIVYYLATLAVLFCIYNILTLGLNIQFGYTGILDFAYITFLAAGAYFAGVSALPRPGGTDQEYILGLSWPFPLTLALGAVVAGLLGIAVGGTILSRWNLRSDYLGIVTVAFGTICYDLVGNLTSLFNGWFGLRGIPQPLNRLLNLNPNAYTVFFLGLCVAIMLVLWFVANRIYHSPLGRTMRAIREDVDVAATFGKDTVKVRMLAMCIGCIYAGIAGGLLIEFIGGIAPDSWTTAETFIVWAAMIIGGQGNNLGAAVGTLLVTVVFIEGTRFLPPVPGHPLLIAAARNIAIGILLIVTLRFHPQGLVPERKARSPRALKASGAPMPASSLSNNPGAGR